MEGNIKIKGMNKRIMYTNIILASIILFFLLFLSCSRNDDKGISIAAAANLRNVLEEIKEQYLEENKKDLIIKISYGSSGLLAQQIINGAPFDIFLSADTILPYKIYEQEKLYTNMKIYCKGRLVLWSSTLDVSQGLEIIKSSKIKKIAIANPELAPYGRNALNVLKKTGLYEQIQKKIIFGENINQVAQFASSGNVEVSFIALSLVLSNDMKNKGTYYIIPENISPPVRQGGIITKRSTYKKEVHKFMKYLTSSNCDDIWIKYGYTVADK